MKPQDILSKATWNKNTVYLDQITFIGEDGYQIHVVRSAEGISRATCEKRLVELVQERYGNE